MAQKHIPAPLKLRSWETGYIRCRPRLALPEHDSPFRTNRSIFDMAKTRFFKATNSKGRTVTRSSQSKVYDKAFIHDQLGVMANWASAGHTPAESKRWWPGEICPAVEIEGKEYRAILAGR